MCCPCAPRSLAAAAPIIAVRVEAIAAAVRRLACPATRLLSARMSTRAALCVVAALVAVYLALLHRQLRKGHPDARARPLPTDDELWRISEYEDIEARELEGIRPLEEQYGVAVVGASGLLGRALVRLLRRRGHRASGRVVSARSFFRLRALDRRRPTAC